MLLLVQKPKIISLVGLTASGKSSLGIKIAKEFNGEIISADSRQVYRGLDIGTAKVTPEEQAIVPHHLIDVVEPETHFDVFEYQRRAYKAIDDILSRGKLPIIVGGTGLYSRSIIEGYNFGSDSERKYDVLQICLLPPKEDIRPIIEKRIDERLAQGMIKETQDLIADGVSAEWLQKLGLEYFWNVEYIKGRATIEEYKKNLLTKTMQFAKRQRTWYRREKNTEYLTDPKTFYTDTIKLIKRFIT